MRVGCKSNIFVFDDKLFLQLLGVAMGSRSSPTYACIFMGMLEVMILFSWEQAGCQMPYLWRRFIDDMFFLWRGSEESLLQFVAHLNSVHATIKFEVKPGESINFSTRFINFLDLTLYTKLCRVISYRFLPPLSYLCQLSLLLGLQAQED